MPPRPLDLRVEELRSQPGRTWGVREALLGVLAVPASLSVGLLASLAGLPGPLVLVVASAALVGLAVLAGRRAARESGGWSRAVGLELPEWSDVGRVVGWTVLLLVLQAAVLLALLQLPGLRGTEPASNVDVLRDADLPTLLVLAVLVVTVAPVVEEVLFRGLALRGLMLRLGFWPAALLSSLAFAVLHAPALDAGSLTLVARVAVLGLGLCLLTRRTGRLGPAIGVHALHNATAVVVTVLVSG